MDYSYANEDKTQRRRVFIVTTAIAAIVLGIAVWAIIAIVSSAETNNLSNKDNNTIANVDDNNNSNHQEDTVLEKPSESTPPETEGVNNDNKTETEKPAESTVPTISHAAAQTEVPETGPEELLPLALVAGLSAMYVSSKKLAGREITA